MPRRRLGIGLVLLAVLVAVVFALRAPLLRATASAAIAVATGTGVSFGKLAIDADSIDARDVHVTRGSGLVADVPHLRVRYDLHEAIFGGGAHRYGLIAVTLEHPSIQLIRGKDGSFDVGQSKTPAAAPSAAASAPPDSSPPLLATIDVDDAKLALHDPGRYLAGSRDVYLAQIGVHAKFDTKATSAYTVVARVPGDAPARMSAMGRFDASGFAVHRVRANAVAILPFVDYFINTSSAQIFAGTLYDGDVRFYSFGHDTHVAGSARVSDGAMSVPGLLPAASKMNGRIDFYDNGISTTLLHATLGPLAARIEGGLYGFDATSPSFRLGIAVTNGSLQDARKLFSFSRTLPIAGDARIETFLEGFAPKPIVITRVEAARASYGPYPLSAFASRALLYDSVVDVADTHARYDGLDVSAGGTIAIGDVAHIDLLAAIDGPASRVPYAAQLAPGAHLHAVARLAGDDLKLDARGELSGAGGTGASAASLDGFFHIDPYGEGTFGPLLATRGDGASIAGTFYLDRQRSDSAFWLDAKHYAFAAPVPAPRFPGLDLYPPDFDATLDGSVAGFGPPSDFRLAGHVRAHDLRVAKLAIGDVAGDVTGHIGDLRLGRVVAAGAWGSITGSGAYVGTKLALDGYYRGTFEKLRAFTGELGARGPLAGPVALTIDPKETVVQSSGIRTPGVRVRGVPLDAISGTLAIERDRLHLLAAGATVASGTLAAAGTLATVPTGNAKMPHVAGIGVSISDADASRLHAIAPVDGGGSMSTIGRFANDGKETRYDGGVAVAGARFQKISIDANGDIGLAGTRLAFARTTAKAADAIASLDGRLSNLGTKRPRYDANVALTDTQLAPLVHAVDPGRNDLTGTIAGTFGVHGSPDDLTVRGKLRMPEGSVNGLNFRDAAATIAIAPGGLGARDGTVTVGSTVARFGGFFHAGDGAFRIDAPTADLSDFNDFFDTGDTLGGRGHVRGRFFKRRGVVRSSADIDIASLKYRTFNLGDATAMWNSRGEDVTGKLSFGGTSGRLETAGTLGLAANAPLDRILERSRFNGTASLRDLDLGVWLPALGYQLPVTGRLDGDASIAGPLRNPDVRTSLNLVGGTIGKLPVDRFALVASSTLRRTTVQTITLDVPSLSLTGSGNFGLGAKDAIELRLHAKSPNVGALASNLLSSQFPVTGTGEADVTVDGTRASPRVAGGFDLENAVARGIAIPRALGEFSIKGRDLVLSDVEVGFTTGALYVAGSVPLELSPFSFGPARAPVELDLTAKNISLANFAPLFPAGSTLKGTLAGRVDVTGTAGAPQINGSIALANGAATTSLERVPITDLRATLAFEGTNVALRDLHAVAGGGTLDASGSATLADLVNLGADARYRFDAKARGLHLDLPAYGSGQIDGTLALSHQRGQPRTLHGNLMLNDGTIPFAALLLASGSTSGDIDATPVVGPDSLALDLDVAAERNVRVRSANVDLGGRGKLHVGGTLAAPALDGGFDSTGGTLTYFNTVFRVIDGRVSFAPDRGVIPDLTAHAETHVIDPDPNTIRNFAGTADVTLDVHGPVTGLAIGLTSDPQYDRQQILGLLLNAPALGATDLFDTPGQATLYGSNNTSAQPRDVAGSRYNNGSTTVAQEAFGVANAQFTRTLLAPAETTFANAVGLTNFNVNVDLTGNVGLQARKVLGKEVSAVYGTTIGYPYRQTFGFEIKPNPVTAAQVTVFQTFGNAGLTSLNPETLTPGFGSTKLTSNQPSSGTVGFALSLQRLFP